MSRVGLLRHAVRVPVVVRYTGILSLVVAGTAAVPLVLALLDGGGTRQILPGIATLGLAAASAGASSIRAPRDVHPNEAVTVLALPYLLASGLMAVHVHGGGIAWIDAVFEAVSGITTTGLSTRESVAGLSGSQLFLRSWMQWIGGFGFAALSVALIMRPGGDSRELVAEGEEGGEDLVGSARRHVRRVLKVYLALTFVGVLALWTAGLDPFAALLLTMSSVSTGGFAPTDGSLADLDGRHQQVLVMALCAAASLPLLLYAAFFTKSAAQRTDRIQAVALVALAGLLTAATIPALAGADRPFWDTCLDGALLAVSAQSTAGFTPVPVEDCSAAAKVFLMGGMFVGACEGSSAGGVKVFRLLLFLAILSAIVRRTGLPKAAVSDPSMWGLPLRGAEVHRALTMVILYGIVNAASAVAFVACGYPALDSLFDVVSATGTVGLSTGVCAHDLATPLKLVLCGDMLLGRLEVFAWLVLFAPTTWFGRRPV